MEVEQSSNQSFAYMGELYASLKNQERDFRNNNLFSLVLRYLRPGSVLDIGCGAGGFLRRSSQAGFSSSGVDPNPHVRKIAKKYVPDVTIHPMLGTDITNLNTEFDNITILDVLEHIEDDRAQLQAIFESLRPGGRCVIVVPAHQVLHGVRDENAGHIRRYSRDELVNKVRDAGFDILRVRSWNTLGILPYFISEKIFRRELNTNLRTPKQKSWLGRTMQKALYAWFEHIENNIPFGIGLSLIVVCTRPNDR